MAKKQKTSNLKRRRWTPDEKEYLEDSWGRVSIKTISKRLDRTETAVIQKAQKLQCGAFLESGGYITLNKLFVELYGKNSAQYSKNRFVEKYGLPVKNITIIKKKCPVIQIDDFWKWAEKNKLLLDFSKMCPLCFGEEPEWLKAKRTNDKKDSWQLRPHNTPWTNAEDKKLERLLKRNCHTYTQLSKEFRRTEGAIKRRIYTLGIQERPVPYKNKTWTYEEKIKLLELVAEGFSWNQIGEKMERSAMSVRACYERLQNPDYMKRRYRGKGDYKYTTLFEVSPEELKEKLEKESIK